MTETLSGLDLRIAVAKKLGFLPEVNESFNIEIGNDGRTWEPGTRWSITNGSYAYLGSDGTVESAWRTVPAFESDLGALQASGVIDALFDGISYDEWASLYQFREAGGNSKQLATEICRTFLAMETNAG